MNEEIHNNPDRALERLGEIAEEFKDFLNERGSASESDTRAKVITAIVRDVCGWPEREIQREKHTESGRLDYQLTVRGKPLVVLEAKAAGEAFLLPVSAKPQKMYSLTGTLVTDKNVKDAIYQVREYCDDEGIRYAVATNGDAWIIFRAIRDDNVGWKKGKARVFPSIQHIIDNFTEFWNVLSYTAICGGALYDLFSTSLRTSRDLHRVVANHFNPNLPLLRNRLNNEILPLIKLVFEDIADQEELEVLKSCYIHTGTLENAANDLNAVITETIPKFLVDEGTVTVGSDHARGGFLRSIKDSVSISRGELILLLGAIGSGKSTFLKRYRRSAGQPNLDQKSLWFVIDFLHPPDSDAMQEFVWRSILGDIRNRYSQHDCEKRSFLVDVFADEITALCRTKLNGLGRGTAKYQEILSDYLADWMVTLPVYVPKLIRTSCKRLGLKPVLFIDNVDQLSPEYQRNIFLFAQHVTEELSSVTIVALREESYYSASVQKTFTAYKSRKFHIAPPFVRKLLNSRIDYARARLEKDKESLSSQEYYKREEIRCFLEMVQAAIEDNRRIASFIKTICYGNMRFALEMFCTFLTSGVTDVGKMLKIHARDGWYNVAYHEFVKAIMLGDRAIYKEDQSPICNLFNTGPESNSSHFTACRIIRSLMEHRGQSTREGRGYVELSIIVAEFESVFDNTEDVIATLNRLVSWHLIEPNNRSTESVVGASHVRITSAGWFIFRYLAETFAYLDLVLQDTPINDSEVEYKLRQSVYAVNNLPDFEDKKIERTEARFQRVGEFIAYLSNEESLERRQYGLDELDSPIAEWIVPRIKTEFESERDWIKKRISQNREKFREDHSYRAYDEEAAEFLNPDGDD